MKAVFENSLEMQKKVLIARHFPKFVPPILTRVTGDEITVIQVCSNFFPYGKVEDCWVQRVVLGTLFELRTEAHNRLRAPRSRSTSSRLELA